MAEIHTSQNTATLKRITVVTKVRSSHRHQNSFHLTDATNMRLQAGVVTGARSQNSQIGRDSSRACVDAAKRNSAMNNTAAQAAVFRSVRPSSRITCHTDTVRAEQSESLLPWATADTE